MDVKRFLLFTSTCPRPMFINLQTTVIHYKLYYRIIIVGYTKNSSNNNQRGLTSNMRRSAVKSYWTYPTWDKGGILLLKKRDRVERYLQSSENAMNLVAATNDAVIVQLNSKFILLTSSIWFPEARHLIEKRGVTIFVKPPQPQCVFYECRGNCIQRGHKNGGICTINGCRCLR